nr:hypothetical protein BaRGS_011027 [Batillaria attramentaria]
MLVLCSSLNEVISATATDPTTGVGAYGKWGIGVSNTDAFGIYRDDMLGTQYVTFKPSSSPRENQRIARTILP